MARPQGLKLYPALLTPEEVDELLAQDEFQPQSDANVQLFRLFGDFGGKAAEPPTKWMTTWGETLQERGVFTEIPNQYRVCDWVGDLSAQFKWHIDNHRHGEDILAISLSERRKIGFRNKEKSREQFEIELGLGDAYMMRGSARWQWEHCVLPCGQERSGGKSFVLSYKRQ